VQDCRYSFRRGTKGRPPKKSCLFFLYRKDVALNNLENCHSNVYFGVKNAASTPVAGIASKAASCALSYKARTALDEFIINDLFTGRVIELFYLFLYLA